MYTVDCLETNTHRTKKTPKNEFIGFLNHWKPLKVRLREKKDWPRELFWKARFLCPTVYSENSAITIFHFDPIFTVQKNWKEADMRKQQSVTRKWQRMKHIKVKLAKETSERTVTWSNCKKLRGIWRTIIPSEKTLHESMRENESFCLSHSWCTVFKQPYDIIPKPRGQEDTHDKVKMDIHMCVLWTKTKPPQWDKAYNSECVTQV